MEETVEITKSEYEILIKSSYWLACLEDAGVYKWDGIKEAEKMFYSEEKE